MWPTVLALAVITATEPLRFGIAIFLISGPRPVVNLLAFWVGGMATGIGAAMLVLIVLHDIASNAMVRMVSNVGNVFGNSTCRHLEIAAGFFALVIAALIAGTLTHRQRVPDPAPADDTTAILLDTTPSPLSRVTARTKGARVGLPLGGPDWSASVQRDRHLSNTW